MTLNPRECTLLQFKKSMTGGPGQAFKNGWRYPRPLACAFARTSVNVVLAALIAVFILPVRANGSDGAILIAMTDEVRNMCLQGEQLINSGKTREAVNLLNQAQRMDPSCGEVHGYLGMAYQNSGSPQKAIPEYMKALELNPQMTFINVNLGTCLMNMNQLDQAVPYFQRYLETTPNAPDAAQVRAYIQQAGSRKGQQNLRGVVEQGQALLNQKRFNEARSAFQQALSIDPNFAPAHFFLGYALAQSGQMQQAIGEFQAALQIDPNMKEAVLNIGSNYQSLGDCPNAIAWYQRYLKENPGSPKAGEIQQRIQGLKKQMQEARAQMPGQLPSGGDDYLANAAAGGKYFRWSRMPIRVCIASGAGVPGYRDSYYQALIDAFSQWAVGSENRISFFLAPDPSQSDIFCDWTADPNRIAEQGRAVEGGLTKLNGQPFPNGVDVAIMSARMTILTNRGGIPLSDDDMKKVCLHEVGHALGINGHSNNNVDVMFFSESPAIGPLLTQRDRATICRLYGNYPRIGAAN